MYMFMYPDYFASLKEPSRRRYRGDTTRVFVRLAQAAANRGERFGGDTLTRAGHPAGERFRAFLRTVWPFGRRG